MEQLAAVVGEAEDELHFFDRNKQIDSCTFDKYLQQMPAEFKASERAIDATPDLLCDPLVARFVGTLFPDDLKMIALLRDPIHRAHAAWDQNRRLGVEPRSFREAVLAERPIATQCAEIALTYSTIGDDRQNADILDSIERNYAEKCIDKKCWANDHSFDADSKGPACKLYLVRGLADMHVKFWRRHAGPDSLHIVHSEDYFTALSNSSKGGKDSAALTVFLRPVFDFIGLERIVVQAPEDSNANCSHQCDIQKESIEESMDDELWSILRTLYAGSMSRLQTMTGLAWEGWE